MKRTMRVGLATFLVLAVAMPTFAETTTSFGFEIDAGNAAPPSRGATAAPRTEKRPGAGGMLFNDGLGYTMFRYNSWYYVNRASSPPVAWLRDPVLGLDTTLTPRARSVPTARELNLPGRSFLAAASHLNWWDAGQRDRF